MRDSGETMTENLTAPAPFKLEREVTLMPSEFHERLSAKHKSKKTSAGRPTNRQTHSSKPSTGRLRYSKENTYSNYSEDSEGCQSPQTEGGFTKTQASYEQSVKLQDNPQGEKSSPQNSFFRSDTFSKQDELVSTSSHIELTGDVKFMLDNAYTNYETEGGFTVKTPPKNMQIKDLMLPLDNWSDKETIQEKKYTVLPSIQHKKSSSSEDGESTTYSNRNSSGSINNQLDFFRDRIEQEADFFADFRVNTSTVKPTPRQDPLPPIKLGTKDAKSTSNNLNKQSLLPPKNFLERRDKNGHFY